MDKNKFEKIVDDKGKIFIVETECRDRVVARHSLDELRIDKKIIEELIRKCNA